MFLVQFFVDARPSHIGERQQESGFGVLRCCYMCVRKGRRERTTPVPQIAISSDWDKSVLGANLSTGGEVVERWVAYLVTARG